MSPKKLLPTNKTKSGLLLAATLLLVSAAIYGFAMYTILHLEDDIQLKSLELENQKSYNAGLQNVKSILSENAFNLGLFNRQFVPKSGVIQYLDRLEMLATEKQVELIISLPDSPVDIEAEGVLLESLVISLQLNGEWQAINQYIEELLLMNELVQINNLAFDRAITNNGSLSSSVSFADQSDPVSLENNWNARLDIMIYQQK